MQQQFALQQQSRPLSWHPKSYPDFNYATQGPPADVLYNTYPQFMYGTTTANGLATPMSYAMPDEPQIQELISPLEDLSAQETGTYYGSVPYDYQYWTASGMGKEQVYAMDNMFPQQQQVIPQTWQFNPHYMTQDVPTAPSSPTFLPIQGTVDASPLSLDTQKLPSNVEGEELVGMGLYDSPADVQASNLLFGEGTGMGRKRSLKLEDSFEPPPESSDAGEDDEADAEEEDYQADEDADDERSLPIHQHQPSQPVASMAGQSFFFDSEADANAAAYASSMAFVQNQGYQMPYPGYGWV